MQRRGVNTWVGNKGIRKENRRGGNRREREGEEEGSRRRNNWGEKGTRG